MNVEQDDNSRGARPARPLTKPLAVMGGLVLSVGLVASLAGLVALSGGSGYALTDYRHGHGDHVQQVLRYTVSGNAIRTLYPGETSSIDLAFTNPNSMPVALAAGALKISIHSPRRDCPAYPNLVVVRTLTTTVTIAPETTTTLSQLGVNPKNWPVIKMVTTHVTQDACAGMTFRIHYSTGYEHD